MVNGSTIKAVQDIMRKDVGVDGDAQRLGQLVWMIFLKIFDDREYEWEALDPAYQSPIPEGLRWRDWAANDEGLTGDELIAFVNNDLFPALKALATSGDGGRAVVVGSVFEDAYNYMKSGQLLRQVANKIEAAIDFNKSGDRHTFGDLYEQLLKDLQSAGNAGEYYTPRAATQFMVEMTDPHLGESILDPACGTGGFLTCSLEHLRAHYVRNAEDELLAQGSINGVEKKPLPHLLCTTNMILHGVDVPTQIRHDNTLARPLRDYGPGDRVDVIVTNPPFGGTEEDGIENNFPTAFRTRETADLFLVLIMHLLKPGGRAAVVLPDGSLFGEGIKTRIKEKLLTECNLHTIVRLPNSVFKPYASVGTNLLFFEKGQPTGDIWYYEHRVPDGQKAYSMTRPIRIEHFGACAEWWGGPERRGRRETEVSWKVSIDEIAARNFNLDVKNPNSSSAAHEDPATLLGELTAAEANSEAIRERLKTILAEALPAWAVEHLPVIMRRVEDVAVWRQAVLDLAVAGRLTNHGGSSRSPSMGGEERDLVISGNEPSQPIALPESWRWTTVGALGAEFQNGVSSRGDAKGEPVVVLRLADIKNGRVSHDDTRQIRIDPQSITKYALMPGDILVVRVNGSASIVGRFVLNDSQRDALYCDHFIRMRVPEERCRARFLEIAGASTFVRRQVEGLFVTTAGQKTINQKHLASLAIPLPPTEEQDRVVQQVDFLVGCLDDFERAATDIDSVRASLLRAAADDCLAGA